jgi:FSR family fosmidomycin resistance protein-like MFS transporter
MTTIEDDLKPSAMESGKALINKNDEDEFHLSEVVTVAAAHGAHDTYFSYLPTILPLLIKNLALNTTQAGLLTVFSQIPNLLQPVIGHLADRKNLKMLVVLAPTLSGILITLVGVAPSFGLAGLLLLLAGFSSAGFHAISPTMVSAQAGRKVGRGMGFFMVGGELGFGLGPLMVVAAIGYLTLRGLPWLMTLGMLASVILYFRLKTASTVRHAQAEAGLPVPQALRQMSGLMLPIMSITFITGFLSANIVNYLPTFMSSEGAVFALAGASLAVVELSGTLGALLMGLFSDRLGQRNVVLYGTLISVLFSAGFLLLRGWMHIAMLVGVGMSAFVANPAFLSIIQTRFTRNLSLANGVYMSSSFILRSIVVVLVGFMADHYGMRPVFVGSVLVTLLSLPFIFMLPKK